MILDFIAITTLLIVITLFVIITLGTYLVIVGGNLNKTDEEKRIEDEEQMNYLKDYQIHKKRK